MDDHTPRRRNFRSKLKSLVLVAPDDSRAFWAVSRDLSPTGIFVSSGQPLAVGSLLKLEVVPVKGQELQVVARVVRSVSDGFACEFIKRPKAFPSRFKRRSRATTRRYVAGFEQSLLA